MTFLDGFLVGNNDILLKGMTVAEKMFDILEKRRSVLRPYSLEEVRETINKAVKKLDGRVILELREQDSDDDSFIFGAETDKTIGRDKLNPRGLAKDEIIMAGLWQIKSLIEEDLFRKLQSIFEKERKTKPTKRTMSSEEKVFYKFIQRVENNDKISETLQNNMYDRGLLKTKFLLVLDDMVTTGARRMHYDIYDKLVETKEDGYKGTELFKKVVSKIEILSGAKMPDRKSLDREYKLIQSGRKMQTPKLVKLINQGRYRYQGNTSKKHLELISKSINIILDEQWNDLVSNFTEIIEELNETTDEVIESILWTTSKVEDSIDYEYSQLTDKDSKSREQFAGDKYKTMVEKIEKTFKKLKSYFNAHKTLSGMMNDKGFSNIAIDEGNTRENKVREEYRNLMQEIKDYRRYKNQIQEELAREKEATKIFDEWYKQKNMAEESKNNIKEEQNADKQVPLRANSDIESLRARVKEIKERRNKK